MHKFLFSLLLMSTTAAATEHTVIAPHCLLNKVQTSYATLATNHSLALIKINETGINQLVQAKVTNPLCGSFIDMTSAWNKKNISAEKFLNQYTHPVHNQYQKTNYVIQYQKQVAQIIDSLNPQIMWNNLMILTNFKNRYAKSIYGMQASAWIKAQLQAYKQDSHRNDISIYTIQTGEDYKQASVIAKIGTSNESGIVIGAHMDSMDHGRKPAADDDGTGCATVLELAHTLIASGMTFKKPIYLIWYAAEEEGLVGSSKVIENFQQNNIPIAAVLQFDLTGYTYNNQPTMWLMDDFVDKDLRDYLGQLITTYLHQPIKHTWCGYGCSDHAIWYLNGYATGMVAEAAFEQSNPYMHSINDTVDKLSYAHMTDYLKLGAAFSVEMAEPIS